MDGALSVFSLKGNQSKNYPNTSPLMGLFLVLHPPRITSPLRFSKIPSFPYLHMFASIMDKSFLVILVTIICFFYIMHVNIPRYLYHTVHHDIS
ncbi:hypothetical protein NC651_036493 [Populus alba x Populus x berolinensis]|nr:hypothetical protein NC651_036493 [Populus alba x Populus x berolinensis]